MSEESTTEDARSRASSVCMGASSWGGWGWLSSRYLHGRSPQGHPLKRPARLQLRTRLQRRRQRRRRRTLGGCVEDGGGPVDATAKPGARWQLLFSSSDNPIDASFLTGCFLPAGCFLAASALAGGCAISSWAWPVWILFGRYRGTVFIDRGPYSGRLASSSAPEARRGDQEDGRPSLAGFHLSVAVGVRTGIGSGGCTAPCSLVQFVQPPPHNCMNKVSWLKDLILSIFHH